jgi:crotonobetainyl-CoA:carnitine CoA-transferase CaiB-like acyl-CoA transferase
LRQDALLAGVRVVELAGRSSMRFAAMLLAELGAQVVRVESPDHRDDTHPLASELAVHAAWDRGKQHGQTVELEGLLARADVVLTSAQTGADHAFERSLRGHAFDGIHVLATPFGTTGPYRRYKANDLNLAAFGGAAVFIGEPGREPLTPPFMMAAEQSGLAAAVAVLAMMRRPPAPARVDIAEYEVLATNHMTGLYSLSFHLGAVPRRAGHRKPNPYPFTILPCRDGEVCMAFLSGHQWRRLVETMGNPEWAFHERFSDRRRAGALYADELDILVKRWLREHPRTELRDIAVRTRLPLGPLQRLDDLLVDRQLAHRGFWQQAQAVGVDGIRIPTLPFQDRPVAINDTTTSPAAPRHLGPADPPLRGVRVLDLSWVMSGPMSSQILADLGAEVIKVESVTHLDSSRQGLALGTETTGDDGTDNARNMMPYFNNVNRGKRSLVLDLKTEAGRAAFLRLAETADVIVENIGAKALERMGIPCEQLHQRNPRSVILRISMAGQDGPDAALPGYAPQSTALGGLDALCGYPGEPPTGMIALNYGDVSAALFGALATLAALARAQRSGQGTVIDLSMIETHVAALGPVVAARQLGEIADAAPGNSHREFFPHAMYRCRGDDDWISISVTSTPEWLALCEFTQAPEPLRHLTTANQRRRQSAEVTSHLDAWAAGQDSTSAFHQLQGAGIHCAPALGAEELMIDEHVIARDDVVGIEHHLLGYLPIYGTPLRTQPPIAQIRDRAPDLGEHSLDVLREAGVPLDTIALWSEGGAFDGLDIGLTGARS